MASWLMPGRRLPRCCSEVRARQQISEPGLYDRRRLREECQGAWGPYQHEEVEPGRGARAGLRTDFSRRPALDTYNSMPSGALCPAYGALCPPVHRIGEDKRAKYDAATDEKAVEQHGVGTCTSQCSCRKSTG